MRTRHLLVTGLLTALVVPAAPATAAAETCQGRPATLIGTPGRAALTGTEGADVIVTNGAVTVAALGETTSSASPVGRSTSRCPSTRGRAPTRSTRRWQAARSTYVSGPAATATWGPRPTSASSAARSPPGGRHARHRARRHHDGCRRRRPSGLRLRAHRHQHRRGAAHRWRDTDVVRSAGRRWAARRRRRGWQHPCLRDRDRGRAGRRARWHREPGRGVPGVDRLRPVSRRRPRHPGTGVVHLPRDRARRGARGPLPARADRAPAHRDVRWRRRPEHRLRRQRRLRRQLVRWWRGSRPRGHVGGEEPGGRPRVRADGDAPLRSYAPRQAAGVRADLSRGEGPRGPWDRQGRRPEVPGVHRDRARARGCRRHHAEHLRHPLLGPAALPATEFHLLGNGGDDYLGGSTGRDLLVGGRAAT